MGSFADICRVKRAMRLRIISLVAAAALFSGCAQQHRGAARDLDQNVLTGGPVKGTKLDDLPLAVLGVLRKTAPHAEITDIDRITRQGREIYEISFAEPGKNPKLYISADGQVLSNPNQP